MDRQGTRSRVSEQSHKTEMAAALRADFQRLRARGVATTLAGPDEGTSGADPAVRERPDEPVGQVVAAGERGGWVRRAFGRR